MNIFILFDIKFNQNIQKEGIYEFVGKKHRQKILLRIKIIRYLK